ncbi:MAG: NADPH-dependent F420 reductase [Kofleriaceae bacterium]
MANIAVFGTGQVGDVLANGFLANGDAVMRASRDPAKLQAWKASAKGDASIGAFSDAAKWADIIVLAVKGSAAEAVLDQAGAANLAGKIVIDTTNPIEEGKAQGGVLHYFTKANESLMERLQNKVPAARFVKAFNSVGNAFMVKPRFKHTPAMFMCGNDAAAKAEVSAILVAFGHQPVDIGGVECARPIEALCQLWCAPGFLRNDWNHAFAWLTD